MRTGRLLRRVTALVEGMRRTAPIAVAAEVAVVEVTVAEVAVAEAGRSALLAAMAGRPLARRNRYLAPAVRKRRRMTTF